MVRLIKLIRLARSRRIQIVHNHFNWYGLLAATCTGAASVETVHNTYGWFSPLRRILFSLSTLQADRLIAVSSNVKEFTVERFPLLRRKPISIIHNSIDSRRFSPLEDREARRNRIGIRADECVIGFVGRLEVQKAVHRLIDAAAVLYPRWPKLRLMIVGDGSLRGALEARAADLGLRNVTFAGYTDDTSPFYSMFDIFALPSAWEGLPLTVLEAMACKCPVVAMNVGGVPEAVIDGMTGFAVPQDPPARFVEAIETLIRNPGMRRSMGEAGRSLVEREFSLRTMIERTDAVYRGLVRDNRKGRSG
jgi:glycosyltransferase involved in cell wall biosynthesis